ncbi:MFS transporter [Pseudoxanthobacter sp. M-2]|uniref:MFS transporter n=1 Tax=Pseudoxanthobacter sp. M-2 TaxID=3078754 RepID=UPI0038FD1FBB
MTAAPRTERPTDRPTTVTAAAGLPAPWTISLYFAAIFLSVGVHLPYFPIYLAAVGLTPDEIGIVLAVPMAARVVTLAAMGALADRIGSLPRAILAYAIASLAIFGLVAVSSGVVALLVVSLAFTAVWTTQLPIADAAAMAVARAGRAHYGRMRLCGSAAFIAASLAAGAVLGVLPATAVWPMMMATLALTVVAAALMAASARSDGAARPAERPRFADAVLAIRPALPLVAACALVQGSHAMVYGFGSLAFEARGFSGAEIGMLWGIGVIGEVILFALPHRWTSRPSASLLAVVAALAAIVRWVTIAAEPGFAVLIAAQALHAFSFAATHLALVRRVSETASPGRTGAVQSLAASVIALVMASATALSGPLYTALGSAAFLTMTVPAGAGLLIAAWVMVREGR